MNLGRYVAFWNADLRKLSRDFTTPLNTEVILRVLTAEGREEQYRVDQIPAHLSLSDRDLFALKIHPALPLYVYLYWFEQDNVVRQLYPVGRRYAWLKQVATLPAPGVWFNPDSLDGKTILVMVLSRWRCRDLEEPVLPTTLKRRIARRETVSGPIVVERISVRLTSIRP